MAVFIFALHFLVYSIFARVLNWSLPVTYYLLTSPLTTLHADKGGLLAVLSRVQFLIRCVQRTSLSRPRGLVTFCPTVYDVRKLCSDFSMAHRYLEIYVCSYILQTCCFQTWISLWQEDILFGGWPKMRKNGQFHKLYARDLVSQMRVLLRYHLYSFENMPYIGNTSRSSYFVIYLSMDDQDMW